MQQRELQRFPDPTCTTWPKGVPYIIGNEGCERFSYYGMNAILYIYVVSLYANLYANPETSANMAMTTVHLFKTGVYALPMIGAIVADRLLGKYKTIFWLSLVYCAGHVVLSATEGSVMGLNIGLGLIAVGSGGIKPCVSANVGDQFGRGNWHLLTKVYQAFYFMINFGSFFATLLIPLLKEWFGFRVAFLVPGILMFIATMIFWSGRRVFVHVPPQPAGKLGVYDTFGSVFLFMTIGSLFFTSHFSVGVMIGCSLAFFSLGFWIFQKRQALQADDGFFAVTTFMVTEWFKGLVPSRQMQAAYVTTSTGTPNQIPSRLAVKDKAEMHFGSDAVEGFDAVLRLTSVFAMVSIFWALFEQHSSSWIRQAEMMNLNMSLPFVGNLSLLASQIPSLNPVLVMMIIPFLNYTIYPLLGRFNIRLTAIQKMTSGMLIAALAFASVAFLQLEINEQMAVGSKVSVAWQIIPYFLLTLAEVLVSVTGLEFAYSQAPKKMKSTVMGFWMLTVAFGNVLVALLAAFSNLQLADFFWVFCGLMAVAGILFGIRGAYYIVRDYPQ